MFFSVVYCLNIDITMKATTKISLRVYSILLLVFTINIFSLAQNVKIGAYSSKTITCLGNPASLEFTIGGAVPPGPFQYYYTLDGAGPYLTTGPNGHTQAVTVAGTYVIVNCIDLSSGNPVPINAGNDTQVMTADNAPTVNITPISPANTTPSTNLTLNSNAAGGVAPLTYLWSDGGLGVVSPTFSTSTTFNSATAGSFNITVRATGANSCYAQGSITVNVYNLSATVATTPSPANICPGGSVLLNATPTGGSGNYTHSWSGSPVGSLTSTTAEDPTFTYSTPGTYNLNYTVTDVTTSATASVPVSITVNSNPTIKTVNVANYCVGGAGGTLTVVSIDANVNYTLYNNATGLPVGVAKSGAAGTNLGWNPVTAGTYFIRATSTVTTCSIDFPTNTIVANPLPSFGAGVTADDYTLCSGTSTQLHANATSGVPINTYAWIGGPLDDITIEEPTATPISDAIYSVTVTDNNGCTASQSVSITVNQNPLVTISPVGAGGFTICAGSPISLRGTSNILPLTGWAWNTNAQIGLADPISDFTYSPGTSTNVTLDVVDINGCVGHATKAITVNEKPNANPGPDRTMCDGVGTTLDATGSSGGVVATISGYNWVGVGTNVTETVFPNATTTYTLIVTNSLNCTDAATVTITHLNNPTVSVTSDAPLNAICHGDDIVLTATPAGGSGTFTDYLWTPTALSSSSITVFPTNAIYDAPDVIHTYSVDVTDNAGCIGTGTINVTVSSLPFLSINNDGAQYCQNTGNVTLIANRTNASSLWTSPTLNLINGPSFNQFSTATADNTDNTYPITYTFTNTKGCVNSVSGSITILPYSPPNILSINTQNGPDYCHTDATPYLIEGIMVPDLQGEIGIAETLTFSGPAAAFTDNGDGTGTLIPSLAGQGSFTFTYSVTTAGSCDRSATQTINIGVPVTINAPPDRCKGDVDWVLTSTDITGTWTISFEDDATHTITTINAPYGDPDAILQADQAGTYTISYTVTNLAIGCTNTTTATCVVHELPDLTFNVGSFPNTDLGINFCSNSGVASLVGFNGLVPAGGAFSGTGVLGALFDPSVGAGSYTITYSLTDANGCSNSVTSQNVTVNAAPVVDITDLNAAYCKDAATFTITGDPLSNSSGVFGTFTFPLAWTLGDEYTVSGLGTAEINPGNINPTGTFNLSYTVTDANGCSGTTTETFDINALPTVDFNGIPASGKICKNAAPITLTGSPTDANGDFTVIPGLTDNGNGTATFNPNTLTPGNHNITYTYTDPVTLCTNTISKIIEVLDIPIQYSLTDPSGSDYCEGGVGVPLGVTNSQNTFSYALIRNGATLMATWPSVANGAFTFVGTYTNGNYTVVATHPTTGCKVNFINTITVNEIPAIDDAGSITGNATVCADGVTVYNYSVPVIANATDHIWTIPAVGVTISADNDDNIDVIFDNTFVGGNISVYGNDPASICPAGNSSFITVAPNPEPTTGAATISSSSGIFVVCEGTNGLVYSTNPADFSNETSFEWEISAGTAVITSTTTTSSITVNYLVGSTNGYIRVRGVNACGASAWVTQAITVNPIPNVSINALGAGDVITCAAGSQVQLNAATTELGAPAWMWTASGGGVIVPGDETVIDPFVTHEGNYQVQIAITTLGLTCYNTASIAVGADKVAPAVSIDVPDELTCTNLSSVTLQVNAVNVTYSWSFTPPANITNALPHTMANPTVDQPGTYTVTVTDLSNSCTASESTTVTRNMTPPNVTVVTPSTDVLTCTNLTATLDGGSSATNKTYLWTGPDPTITNATSEDAIVDIPGLYTLEVTDTDNGCKNTATVLVTQNTTPPIATIANVDALNAELTCTNTSVDLQASVAGMPNATFVWSTAGGNFVSQSGPPLNALATVNLDATYSVIATNPANGCQSLPSSITISKNTTTAVTTITSAGTELTCSNLGVLNLLAAITGDAGTGTYTWTGPGVVAPTNLNNVNVTLPGTYTLTYGYSTSGCTTTANVVVTDRTAPPTVSINAGPYIKTCANISATSAITPTLTATGDANPLTSYEWSGPVGANYSAINSIVTTVDLAGTYTITATNPYGCKSSASVTVTSSLTPPNISVTTPAINQLTCLASTVQVAGSSTTLPVSYLWTPDPATIGATISTPTNNTTNVDKAGVYWLKVTNTLNGCNASLPVTVTENKTVPTISLLNNNDIIPEITCSNTSVQLQATVVTVPTATFSWSPGTGLSSGAYNQYNEVSGTGIYTATATHPISGCTDTKTITVVPNYSTPTITILPDAPTITCAKPTIILDGATSSANATNFVWTYSAGGNITNGGTTNTATISTGATYTLTAEHNITGCPASASVVITEDKAAPSVTVTGVPYTLTCTNTSLTLSAIASAGTVAWTGPGPIVDEYTLNPTVNLTGNYRITATAANGCSSFDDVVVGLDTNVPDISVSQNPLDITCTRTSVSISGLSTVAGVSYLWTRLSGSATITNPTLPTASVNATGDFRLTVTAPNGCTNSGNVSVYDNLIHPNLTLLPIDGDQITCSQTTVLLDGSSTTSGVQYSWSTLTGAIILNGGSPTPTVNKTGDYTVVVTDPTNGCTTSGTTTVQGLFTPPNIVIAAPSGQITCTNPTIQLDATGTTLASNYQWVASNGGHIQSGATNTQPIVDAAGRYTLTAYHNITGCPATFPVDVTSDASLPNIDTFNPFPDVLTCTTSSVQLLADASSLTTKSILWTTTDGNITSANNIPDPWVNQPGTYTVRITNTTNGCYSIRGVTVEQNITLPTIQIDDPLDLTCSILQVSISATATSVDGSPMSYSWLAGAGGNIVSGPNTLNPVVNAVADYTLTVTDNSNGCSNSSLVSVAADITPPNVSVDTSPDDITCDRASVQLNGSSSTPNISYLWTGPGGIINPTTTTPTVSAVGTYNLVVTNLTNNCTITSANVVVASDLAVPTVIVNLPSGDLTCNVSSVTLSASNNTDYNYSWSGPGNISTPNSYTTTVDAIGTYNLVVEDNTSGCNATYTVDVDQDITPAASPIISNIQTCFGTANPDFTVTSGSIVKWYGDPGLTLYLGTGLTYTPLETAIGVHSYYATSTGINGCEGLPSEVTLTIHSLPNAPITNGNAICEGSAGSSIAAVGNNIRWYDASNVFIVASSSYTPAVIAAGSYTYYATQTDINGCESQPQSAIYTINTVPLAPVFVDASLDICEGGVNPSFTAIGSNIKWYKNLAGAVISTQNTYQPLDLIPASYTYYATQTSNQCESPTSTGTFTINPLPIKYNVTGGGNYCESLTGLPIGLSNSQTGVNYELWLDGTTLITDLPGTTGSPINFGNQQAAGTYTVIARNLSGCTTMMNGSVAIVLNPLPSTPNTVSGPSSVCQGETVVFSIDPITNATSYQWTIPAGMQFVSGTTQNTITVYISDLASTGSISVVGVNSCGNGPISGSKLVQVNSLPLAPAGSITGITSLCEGQSGTYEITPITGATSYEWTLLPGMTVVGGANTSRIDVQFAMNESGGNIWVQGKNGCGLGPKSADLTITVKQIPEPLTIPDINVCATSTTVTTGALNAGENGLWTVLYGSPAVVQSPTSNISSVTNLRMGQNTLVWTLTNNGCPAYDTVNIFNNIVAIEAGDDQVVCSTSTTLQATAVTNATWSIASGWGSGIIADAASHISAVTQLQQDTNKFVWQVNKSGCVSRDTVTIYNYRPNQPYAGIDQIIDVDNTILDGSITETGTTGYWSIHSGSGTFTDATDPKTQVNGLISGTNILVWTVVRKSCSLSDEMKIENIMLADPEAGINQSICTNYTTLDAIYPPIGTGEWSVMSGQATFADPSSNITKVTDLGYGNNWLKWTVRTSGLGVKYDSVLIVNNIPSTANAGPDLVLCTDTVVLMAGAPIYGTGTWTLVNGSGDIADLQNPNSVFRNIGQGKNDLKWTVNNNGCISEDFVSITNNTPTTAYAGLDQTICFDTTILYPNTPSIGTGNWSLISGSGTFTGNIVRNLAPDQNVLRYTITKGTCKSSDDVLVTNNNPTTPAAGYDQNLCMPIASTTLNANFATQGNGVWTIISGAGTFSSLTVNNPTVTNLANGINIYRWTISKNGCTEQDEVIVSSNYIAAAAGEDETLCVDNVQLKGSNPVPGIGTWSVVGNSGAIFDSQNSPNSMVRNLSKGTNTLRWTVTNNGCVTFDDVQITNNQPTQALAGENQAVCSKTANLYANQATWGTGVWTAISGSATFTDPNLAQTTVSNLSGGPNILRWTITKESCISYDDVTIISNLPVNVFAGNDQIACSSTAVLSANPPSIGTGQWSIISGTGSFVDRYLYNTTVNNLGQGNNIFKWTVSSSDCHVSDTVVITSNIPTKSVAGANQIICSDSTILAGNIATSGTGTWTLVSGSVEFVNSNLPNTKVRNIALGNNILAWVIDKGGCQSTSEITITNNSPSKPVIGPDVSICGDSTRLFADPPTLGTGKWTLVSGDAAILTPNLNETRVVNMKFGANTFRWTVTNKNCVLSDDVVVTSDYAFVNAGADFEVTTPSTQLIGNKPSIGTGLWTLSAGGGDIENPSNFDTRVNNLGAGSNVFEWSITYNGCTAKDAVVVNYIVWPTADFEPSTLIGCSPLEVNFVNTSIGGEPYSWSFGDGSSSNQPNIIHTFNNPGTYIVKLTATAPLGNIVTKEKIITVYGHPVANFDISPKVVYTPGQPVSCFNYSSNAKTSIWDFGDGTTITALAPKYTYKDTGKFDITLKVINTYNCADSLTFNDIVHVKKRSEIFFPEAFTPNPNSRSGGTYDPQDRTNDIFYPIIIDGIITDYEMNVYNRSGVLIFQSKDVLKGWDGYYKGNILPQDVYIYKVSGRFNSGEAFQIVHNVLLVRKDK